MYKIVAVADLHGYLPRVEECDLLIVAGDLPPITNHGKEFQKKWLENDFNYWLDRSEAKNKVVIAGNHDFVFEDNNYEVNLEAHYLQDSLVEIDNFKIWGSPWSNNFGPWAFMTDEKGLEYLYSDIPDNINIIISHGPPYGACDRTTTNEYAGSKSLRSRIQAIQPDYVFCGHIHEGYGLRYIGNTRIVNASINTVLYEPTNAPVVWQVR